jgi:linearmycin/streptolysin S transport system permease protein
MPIWTIAKKDLRLLVRDPRALIILLAMPVLFILVLGVSLGEGFGQKPDDRLRISLVDLDEGMSDRAVIQVAPYGEQPWSQVMRRDLAETSGIRLERIATRAEAEQLVASGQRAAVLVFGPQFSNRVGRCSFLAEGINPFHRDGVKIPKRFPRDPAQEGELDAELIVDPTQLTAASIIEQVAQVTLLRVILPWMIGRAFEKIGDVDFIDKLSQRVVVPLPGLGKVKLDQLLRTLEQKKAVGKGVQMAIQELYPKYNLTGKTWADLTRSKVHAGDRAQETVYEEHATGWLKRGSMRYQLLVPSYIVLFAFFLVLTMGWMFVAERRQGTMKRLMAAPLGRGQVLFGKLLPNYAMSVFQGVFLLAAGKMVFGMDLGPEPLWLIPVVATTSLAAMGLALLVAALARTESQVSIFGTLLVLMLAGLSGTFMGDRALMPEQIQELSRLTPHAWALDAYRQLVASSGPPELETVATACVVLTGFGVVFIALAWWFLRLD